MIPIAHVVVMLVVASVAMWVRGHSWGGRLRGPALHAAIGAGAGLLGLAISIALGTPLIESVGDTAVQWSAYPIVRGSGQMFAMVAILVGVSAIVTELVLRGWLVDLVLGRSNAVVAVLAGAVAEALLVEGDLGARLGAGLFGLGLGGMYVAGGRSAVAPICARLAFSLGALALEAMRVVG